MTRESKECMVHRCASCPGVQSLQNYLEGELLQNTDDDDNDDISLSDEDDDELISYKQWTI